MTLKDLDPLYFSDESWEVRLKDWLVQRAPSQTFISADAHAVQTFSQRPDIGLRMAVNMPPYGLLRFLREGRYRNGYELKVRIGSSKGRPSDTRRAVDDALFPSSGPWAGPPPAEHYFGAAVLGGSGVRYYGEYCVVLKAVADDTRVLDRNSYDATFPPLAGLASIGEIMGRLRGLWKPDIVAMVKLKILPELGVVPRRTTAGTASDALLHDESFVEVHKHGTFGPGDVHEVRESAADASVETDLAGRRQRGRLRTVEESIWLARRHLVDRALAAHDIRTRIIVTAGRTPR